ncbi:fibronectin type III domain-containing protein [Tenacibaculum halocynthiae]|uniref:fibronectin type III domain-containing protein n=1 Tax=Tenacibaculum halocynthiae TaxID=1254437 RepID=UPI0038940626
MKKNYLRAFVLSSVLLGTSYQVQSQNKREVESIRKNYDLGKLQKIEKAYQKKALSKKQRAFKIAKQKGWDTTIYKKDGTFMELQEVVNGQPIYYTTFNVDAAKSTRTNHLHNGGSLGLNLLGQGMKAYVWDGGVPNKDHQEYDGAGGNNRVSVGDGSSTLNFHAEHVTATIVASGKVAKAKGMAPHATAIGNDWNNDKAEALKEVAKGMLVSNHSYGYGARQIPDYYFGAYITVAREWDEVMFNAPNYLMVVAAGNDGEDDSSNAKPLDGKSAYDKLSGHSTAKNNLVVANAQDANVDTSGKLISVSIHSSSSEGPTDDLRIKPDITGNGSGVYSATHFPSYDKATGQNKSDGKITDDYVDMTGTSMSAPNVTGSLLLLQQHYKNKNNGSFMKAATLKGLALHTADDAGSKGPDAIFGWGLLNAKAAAEVITKRGKETQIKELTLASGKTYTLTVESDGKSPLLASISWTDRPGTATEKANQSTAILVNDLDLKITKNGTTYSPWRLTGVTTNGKGDNKVDPYERVDVVNASGTYTITVSHKGTLTGNSQNYSLIVTGLKGAPIVCNATVPTNVVANNITNTEAKIEWSAVAGAKYNMGYRKSGTTNWTTKEATTNNYKIVGLTAETKYDVQVRSKCATKNSAYSSVINFTTKAAPVKDTQAPTAPASLKATNIEQTTLTLNWTASTDNVAVTGYDVYQGTTKLGVATNTSYNVTSLTANTAYQFSVKAKDAAGNVSDSSNKLSVTTKKDAAEKDTQAPTAPSNLASAKVEKTTLTLNWTASTDNVAVTSYDVYQGTNKIGTTIATTYNVSGLTADTFYEFSVKAKDAAGNISDSSNEIFEFTKGDWGDDWGEFSINSSTSSDITVFPNPATNFLNIKIPSLLNAKYRVLNVTGIVVKSGQATKSINISKLPKGIYFFEFKNKKEHHIIKFIKE